MKYSWLLLMATLFSCNLKSKHTVSVQEKDSSDTVEIIGDVGIDKRNGGVIRVVDTFIIKGEVNDTQINDKTGRYSTKTKDYIVRWDTIK